MTLTKGDSGPPFFVLRAGRHPVENGARRCGGAGSMRHPSLAFGGKRTDKVGIAASRQASRPASERLRPDTMR
ncbi:hypothetical protein DESPIG_01501 [Desulfovibrio piger ATCC 29098]|uniref:Uncharacterized protein n=1 Tax=Desulfovibrio piger ATCC 29098 TaxID=411464 RepID=B6WTU4_9BACT|nr:hypothetical protein DESPIG_01501 [Desulfovibrio piger ATCC 29098]